MVSYDDPLATILAISAFILVAVWARIYYQPRGEGNQADRQQNKPSDIDAISVLQAAQFGHADRLNEAQQAANQSGKDRDQDSELGRAIEPIEWWTGVMAVATVLAAIFGGFTLVAIRGQLDEMKSAGADTRTLAEADRARLFVKFLRRTEPFLPRADIFSTTAHMNIHNYGRTPAIITNVKARMFFKSSGDDPDPEVDTKYRDNGRVAIVDSVSGQMIQTEDFPVQVGTVQVTVPPNDALNDLSAVFIFRHPDIRGAVGEQAVKTAIVAGTFWFYCVVKYRDVYNRDRTTSYYAKIFGYSRAQSPAPEYDKKYNKWE